MYSTINENFKKTDPLVVPKFGNLNELWAEQLRKQFCPAYQLLIFKPKFIKVYR